MTFSRRTEADSLWIVVEMAFTESSRQLKPETWLFETERCKAIKAFESRKLFLFILTGGAKIVGS